MKFYLSILFLTLIFSLKINAQEEISRLNSCQTPQKLTKAQIKELKRNNVHDYGERIEIFVGIESIILPNGKRGSSIKSQMNSYEVVFKDLNDGNFQGEFNFFIKISSTDKKSDGCFEERRKFTLKKEDIGKKVWLNYNKVFELPEDKYIVTFLIRDIQTGMIGIQKFNFEIE